MADQLKVYVGVHEATVRALALKYFPKPSSSGKREGNISALYNDALRRVYKLDSDTWKEKELDDIGMVADRVQLAAAKPAKHKK